MIKFLTFVVAGLLHRSSSSDPRQRPNFSTYTRSALRHFLIRWKVGTLPRLPCLRVFWASGDPSKREDPFWADAPPLADDHT